MNVLAYSKTDLRCRRSDGELDGLKRLVVISDSIVGALIEALLVPDLDRAKLPDDSTLATIVCGMNCDIVITVEMHLDVLSSVNGHFVQT